MIIFCLPPYLFTLVALDPSLLRLLFWLQTRPGLARTYFPGSNPINMVINLLTFSLLQQWNGLKPQCLLSLLAVLSLYIVQDDSYQLHDNFYSNFSCYWEKLHLISLHMKAKSQLHDLFLLFLAKWILQNQLCWFLSIYCIYLSIDRSISNV